MAKQITLRCKTCDRLFSYSEEAYILAAEKGDSKIERCEDCLESHGKEVKDKESPYFQFRREGELSLTFDFSDSEFSFRGERIPKEETKPANQSGMDISITDDEIVGLYQKLEQNQVVVIVSPTGTGKSTYVPKRLTQPPEGYTGDFVERLVRQGQIIITQPRIFATLQTAQTTARISGEEIGAHDFFGSRYSGGDNSGSWNRAISITDGTLPNWIRQGKLGQYSLIMIDEAHERSCNIDLILGFLKRELPKYPQLRVIISSATINAQKFLDSFREVNILIDILAIPSRKKCKKYEHFWKDENPVQGCDCWLCAKTAQERRNFWKGQRETIKEYDLPEVCANFALRILDETDEGSIVIFLHGEVPINQTTRRIQSKCKRGIEVIPIYRQIQDWARAELDRTEGKRRVIVATNLAETSVTIPDLVYGINSGWIKQIEWDPATQTQKLRSKLHTRDGNRQRGGRLGRNQDGYVYHFFTKEEWGNDDKFEEHTSPEVTRSCLDDSLVTLKAAGVVGIERFPWMERPTDWQDMNQEIKRAEQSLVNRGIVDRKGKIVERSLDLLGIPRSSTEASLLFLADEQGVLFETLTVLILMSSRDGEARTGVNLYNPYCGLLLWDGEWTARTKARVAAIHQGLRVGCQDDLDFVVKLVSCFQRAETNGLAREWVEYYSANYKNLANLVSETKKLITETFGEEREESNRGLDLDSLDKVRLLMISAWPDRIISLKAGNPILYQINNKAGVISPQCVGNWGDKKKALAMTFVEKEAVVDDYPQRIPTASFIVSLPSRALRKDLFADQRFPVDSWVEIKEQDGKIYVNRFEEIPSPIKLSFKKTVWLSKEKREKIISFDQRFILDEPPAYLPQGIWFNERQTNRARIVEWTEQNGIPVAVLTPFAESDISKLGKVKGDSLRVKVHQIARDPIGKNGWALVRTPRFEIPVELSEISLSEWGAGLERIEGQTLSLAIKDFDVDGFPRLSNLEKIREDIKNIRKGISESEDKKMERPYIKLSGFVAEIVEEQERTVVAVPRENGIVHPFEIAKGCVPGSSLKNLRVGEEVLLYVFSQPNSIEVVSNDLTDEEIENGPKEWKIKEGEDKLLLPACLEDKDVEDWPARLEAKDYVIDRSWQYCLQARIASLRERLSKLNEMDLVEGEIQEIIYEEDGKTIKSVQVVISGDVPGFAFGSDLGSLSVSEGDKIPFCIRAVDPNTGFLKLVSKHYEDEKKKKQEEFRRRTQENIQRWENNIRRARENIAKNRERPIRTKEFGEKVKLWIAEDEKRIQDWLYKIDDARRRLKD